MRKSPVKDKKGEEDVKEEIICDKKSNMFFVFREICFIFAVVFTAYASVLNSQSKTKKILAPVPFFGPGCLVDDYYKGDLHSLMTNIGQSAVAIVMYYAPWDADSKDTREIFEEAAQFFGGDVYFASVNCWQPGSECRATFKNIPRYPQIVAYRGPLNAVDYLGPSTASDIIKFIDSVMNPLVRVNTVSEIWQLRFRHDAVLVGCLKMDGLKSARGYNLFYKLAWKMAGRDHTRKLVFAVITHDRLNPVLSVKSSPSFVLYFWNKKIVYDGELSFEEMLKWLKSEMNRNELIKSQVNLDSVTGPVVVTLFSSPDPLIPYSSLYHMLRQVAMKFNECVKSNSKTNDFTFYHHLFSGQNVYSLYEEDYVLTLQKEREICSRTKHVYRIKTCSASLATWSNLSCYQQSCPTNKFSFSEINVETVETYEQAYWRKKCRLIERAGTIPSGRLVHSLTYLPVNLPEVTACDVNKTVIFTFLDPDQNPQLAQALGHETVPSLFIFNDDEIVKFTDRFTEKNISDFLISFLKGKNERFLRQSTKNNYSSVIALKELNAGNFHATTFNNSLNVVVLFYSSSCGWCGSVSQTLLRLSHSMQLVSSIVFSRINMDNNDLPFHLQVHSYPTLIIFPANRKSESRVYPPRKSWSLHTITQFILANLEPKQQVLAMLAACSKWGESPLISSEGDACIRDVRLSIVELISTNLRKWRMNIRTRRKHLDTLHFLKRAHLKLARVDNITNTLSSLL